MVKDFCFDDLDEMVAKRIVTRLLIGVPTCQLPDDGNNGNRAGGSGCDFRQEALVRSSDVVTVLAKWLARAEVPDVATRLINEPLTEELAARAAEEIAHLSVKSYEMALEREEAHVEWDRACLRANDNFAALQDAERKVAAYKDALVDLNEAHGNTSPSALRASDMHDATRSTDYLLRELLNNMFIIAEADGWKRSMTGRQIIMKQAEELLGQGQNPAGHEHLNPTDDEPRQGWMQVQ